VQKLTSLTTRFRPAPSAPSLEGGVRAAWLASVGLGVLQLVVLGWRSFGLWSHFDLGVDFAAFAQAWVRIAHGHLDPYLTLFPYNYPHYGYPFWQSHLELMMWLLAPLYWLGQSTYLLLVVQDLALAATAVAVVRWALEILVRAWPRPARARSLVAAAVVIAAFVNPWTYWVAAYDFHLQPLACLFAVMSGRELWLGRSRAWIWVAATLLCGDVAATYVVALGLGCLVVARGYRRMAATVSFAGIVWLALVAALGSGKGSGLASGYGYLAGGTVGSGIAGIVVIVAGIIRHPHLPLHVLSERRDAAFKYLSGAGTLGVVAPLGLSMVLVVLLANVLNANAGFVAPYAAFQSLVVVWFLLVGWVSVACWLKRMPGAGAAVAVAVAAVVVGQVAWTAAEWLPRISASQVPAGVAAQLQRAEDLAPRGSELVVSVGVIGRFGGHRWVYPFYDSFADGQTVPIHSKYVTFVFTDAAAEAANPKQTAAAIALVAAQRGARVVLDAKGVVALAWEVPPGVHSIRFRS